MRLWSSGSVAARVLRRLPVSLGTALPLHLYPYVGAKTSVYLSEAQAERLSRLSNQEGRPQAEIIREAIAAHGVLRSRDRDFSVNGVAVGDERSIADVADDELLRGFGE